MKKKALIFIVCYIAYTSIYIARLNLSMAAPYFADTGIASLAQIGIFGSIFSVVYAFGRLISGSLGDKLPPWGLICSGLVLSGIANLFFGVLPPFIGMAFLWGINAFAQSMLWSAVLIVVSYLYENAKAKKMCSYMVTSVATGNIAGIIINTFIIDKIGVTFAFIIPGAITLIMSVVCLFFLKGINPVICKTEKHISVFGLLKNKEILSVILPVIFHGAIKDNISLWMTTYFVDTFSIDLSHTAGFVLFIPLVGFAGRASYSFLLKLCGEKELTVSMFAFILCAVLTLPLVFGINSAIIAVICLSLIYALISIINTSMLSIYPLRFSDTGNVASVSGLMDFATYGGAGISSWIYGITIKSMGYSSMYISWTVITIISVFVLLKRTA